MELPKWTPPTEEGKYRTGLVMANSMTGGSKVEFVPIAKGREVTWYGCGPTVYDAPHLGHARSYVTFDMLLRVMSQYLGYDVKMVMNVTDIDDKIIKRSAEAGIPFSELARKWEHEFWEDMKGLNVLLPHVITRVSEYVPEVVSFIEKIIDNGYAYESTGSVYFSTEKFRCCPDHCYGRMEPQSSSNSVRVLEGEGDLGYVSEKRCPLDFALWKKSKEGEPSWESPWGPGRPGWHIECSAMASSILGFPIDIHSGGVDLRFPHHDNELAQSEAHYNQPQWVNYFLHTGHLNIQSQKMSKSLKNFVTIKAALKEFNPRQLRILFALHRWDAPMNYKPDGSSFQEAVAVDKKFGDFFGLVKAQLRKAPTAKESQKYRECEVKLEGLLQQRKAAVHAYLLDNFNIPDALVQLQNLVSDIHVYMSQDSEGTPRSPLLIKAAGYVFDMLKVLGVASGDTANLNYGEVTCDASAARTDYEDLLGVCCNFRHTIRAALQRSDLPALRLEECLRACDDLRDTTLAERGVVVVDGTDGSSFRIVDKEELRAQKERQAEADEKRKEQKAEAARQAAAKAEEKAAKSRIAPDQYFRQLKGEEFETYDEEGIPLTLKSGEPVSKAQRSKMKKELDKHTLLYKKAQGDA